MSKDFDALALFWGGVLSPVIFKPPEDTRSDRQILLELTQQRFVCPDGQTRGFSLATLKRKLKAYREKSIEGFRRPPRSDEGTIRGGREEALKRAIDLKRARPYRSAFTLNLLLKKEGLEPIPESTLQRHLGQRGLTVRKLGLERSIIRKRWSRDHTHSLWVGDFSQGPNIIDDQGLSRKTWISAFIDAHSRFIVSASYSTSSDMEALIRSLLAAFERHGKPRGLYLDNAKVYRSPVLARACLDLGIELIHRSPYDPQGGGIIERFFLTLQKQMEQEVAHESKAPLSLKRLNEFLLAWIEAVYHERRHGETGQTPRQRYKDGMEHELTPLLPEDARASFYNQVKRTVHRDFCDIRLDKKLYRVDASLRGDRVMVRYQLDGPGEKVDLYDLKGRRFLGEAPLHQRSERHVPDPPPIPEEDVNMGELLLELRDRQREKRTPDLHLGSVNRRWDLATFIDRISSLAGVKVDTLDEEDLETMKRLHRANAGMTQNKLKSLWSRCAPRDFPRLLIEIGKEAS